MPLIPLEVPPGVFRPGTRFDARGRWYDSSLVRWYENAMRPLGGWTKLQAGSPLADVNCGGPVRGMLAWRANDQSAHLAMGTHAKLFHFAGSTLTDITPVDFAAGGVDAAELTGIYGLGPYGSGLYGKGTWVSSIEANSWQLDNFGEDLVAVAYSDGKIYWWDKSAGTATKAAVLANAPTGCKGVVVTPERFVVALAAGGDGRKVQWADQESLTDWAPTASNQAGDLQLTGSGKILAGRRGRAETLIWTELDLHALRYIGGSLVYSITQIAPACGAISRHAMGMAAGRAFWMGQKSFFLYDGAVQSLKSDVGDYVFNDLNRAQASKIACDVRAEYGEVTWYYPSSGSNECDRYVTYNYREQLWYIGQLQRTSGVDRGVFEFPLLADAAGRVYKHETGSSYLDHNGAALTPYAESGPISLGEAVMHVRRIVPDEKTLGQVQLKLITSNNPTAAETTRGPYTPSEETNVRVAGRLVRLRVEHVSGDWRFGTPQLDVVPGGLR